LKPFSVGEARLGGPTDGFHGDLGALYSFIRSPYYWELPIADISCRLSSDLMVNHFAVKSAASTVMVAIHAEHAHRAQDGEDLPIAFGRRFGDAAAAPSPSVTLCHLRGNAAFVGETSRSGAIERSCSTKTSRRCRFASVSRSVAWSDLFEPEIKLPDEPPKVRGAYLHPGGCLQLSLQLTQIKVGLGFQQSPFPSRSYQETRGVDCIAQERTVLEPRGKSLFGSSSSIYRRYSIWAHISRDRAPRGTKLRKQTRG
jgi:hypothetical protein